jgi:hypothetical protein
MDYQKKYDLQLKKFLNSQDLFIILKNKKLLIEIHKSLIEYKFQVKEVERLEKRNLF